MLLQNSNMINGEIVKNEKEISFKSQNSIKFVSDTSIFKKNLLNKNLGLTVKRFNDLVNRIKRGDEKLFEIAFEKLVFEGINSLKLKYSIDINSAKDIAIETLLILRKRLIEGKIRYGNIKYLYIKILYQEYFRQIKKMNNLESLDSTVNLDTYYMEEKKYFFDNNDYALLAEAYSELGLVCQEIFKLIFEKKLKTSEVSEELGITPELVRKRKQRCLENLRLIIKKRNKI